MLDRLLTMLGIGRHSEKASLFARQFEKSTHTLRPLFDERYSTMRSAIASDDAHAIAALLTSDFVSVDINGAQTTAEQMINSLVHLDIDRTKRAAVTTVTDIEVHEQEAVLLQHYSMTSAPDAPASMPKRLQTLSRDVWKTVDGMWLLQRTETLEVEVVARNGVHRYRSRS